MPKKLEIFDEFLDEGYLKQVDGKQSATEVLRDIMVFYQTTAKEIMLEIIMKLKDDSSSRADLLAMMYRKWDETTEVVIRCAEKLAPYESPKKQSVEVNQSVEHRFVLRAPEPVKETSKWLEQVGTVKQLEIDHILNQEESDGDSR